MHAQPRFRSFFVASAVAFLTALSACNAKSPQASADSPEVLTGDEIAAIVSGNTLTGSPTESTPWSVYYRADGIELGVYGDDSDTGRWRTIDDQLCSDWDTWGDGERCFALRREDDGTIQGLYADVPEWSAILEPGDRRPQTQD